MKVSELKHVMEVITKYANMVNLDLLYTRFSGALTQILRQNQRVEVAPHKDALFKALETFDWKRDLKYGEQQIFVQFGGDKYLGRGAVDEIESILRDEKFDPVGVADRTQKHLNDTKQLLATANSIVTGLAKSISGKG